MHLDQDLDACVPFIVPPAALNISLQPSPPGSLLATILKLFSRKAQICFLIEVVSFSREFIFYYKFSYHVQMSNSLNTTYIEIQFLSTHPCVRNLHTPLGLRIRRILAR